MDINFIPERFMQSLSYMGKGMLIIFIIIGVIILMTALVNKIFKQK